MSIINDDKLLEQFSFPYKSKSRNQMTKVIEKYIVYCERTLLSCKQSNYRLEKLVINVDIYIMYVKVQGKNRYNPRK